MKLRVGNEKIQMLMYRLHLERLRGALGVLRQIGIEPILIKGAAAAANYPKPFQRVFGDIDLAVAPVDFDAALRLIKTENFTIDLHKGLRHLDTVSWEDLFQNSIERDIDGTMVRVLREEDHLRVMCVHWLNDGGADRSRLWDVYFALKRSTSRFDPDRFLGTVSEKRRAWLITVLLIVRDFLGLETALTRSLTDSGSMPEWVKLELEKEWRSDRRLLPLQRVTNDPWEFFRQVKRRFPPNGLQTIVENDLELGLTNGRLSRMFNVLKRAEPSARRLLKMDPDH